MKHFFNVNQIIIEKIYLFGSRSRGDNQLDSDYDIMILVENEITSSTRRKLLANLDRFLLMEDAILPMDLLLKNSKKFLQESNDIGYLAYQVKKEGIQIWIIQNLIWFL